MKKVLAHGTFDILHYGHIAYLEKAKSYGDYLIVMVTSDDLVYKTKGRKPFFNEDIRKKVISSLKCVDEVIFRAEDISKKDLKDLDIDILVTIYPDSKNLSDVCTVHVVEETKGISSSLIKEYLAKNK